MSKALTPIALSNGAVIEIPANGSGDYPQAVRGFIVSNQSGYQLTTIVSSGTISIAPGTADYVPITLMTDSLKIVASATQTVPYTSPQIVATAIYESDPPPTGYPSGEAMQVSIVGGNVSVTFESGTTVDVGNAVTLAADTTVGISGTVNTSSSETQETNDADSIDVTTANTATLFPGTDSTSTYIRVGVLSLINNATSAATVSLQNGAGQIFWKCLLAAGASGSFPINHNMPNANPAGVYIVSTEEPVTATLTHNPSLVIH